VDEQPAILDLSERALRPSLRSGAGLYERLCQCFSHFGQYRFRRCASIVCQQHNADLGVRIKQCKARGAETAACVANEALPVLAVEEPVEPYV
jgi:hypothetical protein